MKPMPFSMPVPAWFMQPESMKEHNAEVFAGCYDIPTLSFGGRAPVVIDIGACCGAFTLWAKGRWPGADVHAYEANVSTCDSFLYYNLKDTKAAISNGVAPVAGTYPLYRGKNNIGECSRWRSDEQSEEKTDAYFIGVATLPNCDVLKVDTEGEEFTLILKYLETHDNPIAIMCEFHSADMLAKAFNVDAFARHEYVIARADIWQANRGVVCFLRRDVWEKAKAP